MSSAFTDLTARHVPGRGWLPLLAIERDGRRVELYRGEYRPTLAEAVKASAAALEQIKREGLQ